MLSVNKQTKATNKSSATTITNWPVCTFWWKSHPLPPSWRIPRWCKFLLVTLALIYFPLKFVIFPVYLISCNFLLLPILSVLSTSATFAKVALAMALLYFRILLMVQGPQRPPSTASELYLHFKHPCFWSPCELPSQIFLSDHLLLSGFSLLPGQADSILRWCHSSFSLPNISCPICRSLKRLWRFLIWQPFLHLQTSSTIVNAPKEGLVPYPKDKVTYGPTEERMEKYYQQYYWDSYIGNVWLFLDIILCRKLNWMFKMNSP